MHVITNEHALAHWRALCGLPNGMMDRLNERFIRQQYFFVATLLAFAGGTTNGPGGQFIIRPVGDSGRANADRVIETAAMLAEIFQREAGHPLRQLDAANIRELTETNLALFKQFREAAENDRPETAPELFENCAQPALLRGVLLAAEDDPQIKREQMMMECYLMRIVIEGLHMACGDEAADPADWDAERIQMALSAQGDPLRRRAILAGESLRPELTLEFIRELERWAEQPQAAIAEDVSLGMHALFLLAKWREASAWPVFRKLFSLPGDIGFDLMGDLITEDASILLAMVGGRQPAELRAMIEDEALDEYCRGACLDALTCLVAWGEMFRDEHVGYLRELLTRKLREVPANENLRSYAVAAVMDMEAWELSPEIEAAFTRGVVAEDVYDLADFRRAQTGLAGIQWQAFCERHAPVTDVGEATKWLDEPPLPESPLLPGLDEDSVFAHSDRPYIAPPKVGRNDPCPCGSGKKFKKCCGA